MKPFGKNAFKQKPLSEHEIQSSLIAYCDYYQYEFPKLACYFAVPNGIWLPTPNKSLIAKIIAKMKREGFKKGAPDLVFPIPSHDYKIGSLYIEMKKPGETCTPEQKEFHAKLKLYGTVVHICESKDDAINLLAEYFNYKLPKDKPLEEWKRKCP